MNLHVLRFARFATAAILTVTCVAAAQAQESTETSSKADDAKKVKAEQSVEGRRQALQLLAEAEQSLEDGQTARAVALAREALRLYPESKSIAGFLAAVQPDQTAPKATLSIHNRAKAHLAAALTRAQVLMQQRRYTESLDLLNGIIEAAQKFPIGTDVSLYRDLAQKELIEYRVGVQTGKIRPNQETPTPRAPESTTDESPAPAGTEFAPAPTNAYRLARIGKEPAPAWYTRMKASLRKNMSVDYRAMPLGLVLDDIHQATGLPLIVDTPVQLAKTPITAVVDLRVNTVPAETVLALATQVAGCEYVLLEKGIIVTTTDKAGDYIRNLPEAVASHWARARHLFPDLYLEAMANRPLPEVKPGLAAALEDKPDAVPSYLRSGRDLVSHIEQLIR